MPWSITFWGLKLLVGPYDMEQLLFGATVYSPTSSRTGVSGKSLLRMSNYILAGVDEDVYLESYKGQLNLDETIPTLDITGTLDCVEGELTIVGTGTSFTTELRSGQFFWSEDDLFCVNTIIDDTNLTVYRGPITALVASTGERTPVIYNLDRQRATQIQGNAEQFDLGTIEGTGFGTLRINGDVLQGSSLVFTGGPRKALFDPTTGDYTVADLGFDTPTVSPVLSGVAGGVKGMVAGEYSLRFVPSSSITDGYNLPGPRINVTLATAGDRIQADFSGVPMDTAALQDQWDAYGTQLGVVNVNQGPWDFIRPITQAEIAAGGNIVFIEYLNAEIARQGQLDFDADPVPASAGFMATLQGNPQWISCYGKWGGSPGPTLVPSVFNNLEAAPAIWAVSSSPPENLLGVTSSLARLYLLCAKTLQQGIFAPTGDPLVPPTQIRPYWSMGFANPQQLIFALGLLVGYPHGGPTRSIADAETVDAQFIGANVAEIIKGWVGQHTLVEWDNSPMVNAICFFSPAVELNAAGFWVTDVLLWGLNNQDWVGSVRISSDEQDMVVSSVANVDNQLYFLAGGRVGADIQFDTYAWNVAAGLPVDYYAVWELQAGQILDRNKSVKAARVNGKFTQGQLMIYGFDSNTPEALANLETGINPQVTLNIGTTTDVETTFRKPFVAPNNFLFTCRVSGTYSGEGDPDRCSGIVLDYMPTGVRR